MSEEEAPYAQPMEQGDGADEDRSSDARADQRRRRWLRIGLASFIVFVALGITASFLLSASTARLDQTAHTYVGVGAAANRNYVEIDARVGQITPSASEVAVRIDVVPHGTYARNTYALSQAMNVEVAGVVGGHVSYAAGQQPEPVDAQMELLGNLSQYPFDSYRWFVAVDMRTATHTPRVVPIKVVLSSTQHDWRVLPSLASVRQDGTVDINLYAHRSVGSVALALFEMFVMVTVAAIALCISYTAIAGHHELSWGLFGWLGAMLFALPVIRNTMPGVPGIGTLADYTVYFWAILTVALCLLVIAVTYLRRTIKVEEHGKST
jgi:hypothetical protein